MQGSKLNREVKMATVKRSNTLILDVGGPSRTPAEQIRAFHTLLKDVMQNRMEALRDEAETIGNDMQALVGLLEDEGHEASLEDIKSARWYRTAAQLKMLKTIWGGWCEITGQPQTAVRMRPRADDDSDSVPVVSDTTVDEA